MKMKIAETLIVLILIILPFLVGLPISKYSPYIEGNNFQTYVFICTAFSIALVAAVVFVFKYFFQPFESIRVGGALLFLLFCPIVGIFALAAAPDLSLKMLEHPEREHIRYSFLFVAALLFGGFIFMLWRSKTFTISKLTKWIMFVVFIFAFAEFIWEFTHHYLYPEALKEWISQGKNFEEFGKYYDNFNVIIMGVLGRYFQFISVIWLSVYLYKLQRIRIWSPILSIGLSTLGIISATVILITNMNLPKGFEILFLFFIPGIPFILLYLLGVALLTKSKKST